MTAKVFGIGFHKTGSSSLGEALSILGYRVCAGIAIGDPNIRDNAVRKALAAAQHYEAFQDNPWPMVYREMDRSFPGSKFILTVRDTDDWLASVLAHFGGKSTPMREWIYGAGDPEGHAETYRTVFERHNRNVPEYFTDRPGDLLIMNFSKGEGWEKLCSFLGCEIPSQPFPHANKGTARRLRWKLKNLLRI